jgi:SAM-dependent methyltransferase
LTTHDPEELFRSTAYYARYRPGYPSQLFSCLVELQQLDGTQEALDLGCGTGQIAIPLAASVNEVVAVDPQPDMLEWGERRADEVGVDNVVWKQGDSTTLDTLALPDLDLVTMGASFHWMDRDAVMAYLDGKVVPGGAVVVASGGAVDESPPAWAEIIREIRERYLGKQRRAGSGTYEHPAERHEVILARSPFSDVQREVWEWNLVRDLDAVTGLQLSYSFSAPALLGDRTEAFVADVRAALAEAHPDGQIIERLKMEALIARRP